MKTPPPADAPLELRFRCEATEIRTEDGGEGGEPSRRLVGVAIRYGSSAEFRYYTEKFAAGAFTDSLASGRNVRALFHHNDMAHIGSSAAGSLRLIDSPTELRFELDVAKTTAGDDVLELVRSGECKGVSVGFQPVQDEMEYDEATDRVIRTHTKARLVEVTATPIPAYTDTDIEARNAGGGGSAADRARAIIAERHSTPRLESRRAELRRQIADQP